MTDRMRPGGAKVNIEYNNMGNNARAVAARALLRVETGAYSNLTLEGLCAEASLEPREAAFASALFYTTLERRLTLDHILKHYSSRALEELAPEVRTALRLGVCQILYLEGVDDYAAVSETVELTKTLEAARASGYVNGVLRTFLRSGKKIPSVQGGRGDRLSVKYSCPRWLVKRLLKEYGDDAIQILEASLGKPPLFLRANTLKVTAQELAEILQEQGVTAIPDEIVPGCLCVIGHMAIENLEAFQKGLFHVQDKASQMCALLVGAKTGEKVLDACAAPGGKSFTMAEEMHNIGQLVAMDLRMKRVGLINDGAKRLGLSIVETCVGDASEWNEKLGVFDCVLCDVPCSGFGIMRRKPEIKYKTPMSVENLPELQHKILQNAAKYLKTGGRLVYSTCTLLPEENNGVVRKFLGGNAEFQLLSEKTNLNGDTDGFYMALLEKSI